MEEAYIVVLACGHKEGLAIAAALELDHKVSFAASSAQCNGLQ